MKRFMEEGIPQKRKDRSFEKKMPLKDYGFSPDSSMEEGKKKKYSMDRALLPPRGSRSSRYPTADRVSHRHCHRDATTCSYDIVFCVEGEKEEAAQDDRLLSCFVSCMKWYTINIHADGPGGKVYPKRLLPFSKGQIPLFAALAALGSHIYCFGGKTSSHEPIRDVYKLRVPPRVAKEGEKWVPVSPMMISQRKSLVRFCSGGKIYVCNDLPCNHTMFIGVRFLIPSIENGKLYPILQVMTMIG
jgi:hypothetical protein